MGTEDQAGLGCQWPSLTADKQDMLEKEAVENKRVYTLLFSTAESLHPPKKIEKNYIVMMSVESLDQVIAGVLPVLL